MGDHNKAFTIIALKMLSACSHRWRSVMFCVFCDWPLDGILPCKGNLPTLERLDIKVLDLHKRVIEVFEVAPRLTHASIWPWAKRYGWILPWTQLTELILVLDGDSVIANGEVPNLLPMLQSIKELLLRFLREEMHLEGGLPPFSPTPLNQLRILQVPHPAILSWFQVPSLCHLYLRDHQQYDIELLDIHGQISPLIQRSGCKIGKLSIESGRKFYVGMLKDVEELVINYTYFEGNRPSIDISSLLGLRLLTIICSIDKYFKSSIDSLIAALKSARVPTRSERSSGTLVSILERVTVELQCDKEQPKVPERLLEIAEKWPMVVFRTHR